VRYRVDLAGAHVNLGILLMNSADSLDAEAEFRDALALYQKLADDIPAVTDFVAVWRTAPWYRLVDGRR